MGFYPFLLGKSIKKHVSWVLMTELLWPCSNTSHIQGAWVIALQRALKGRQGVLSHGTWHAAHTSDTTGRTTHASGVPGWTKCFGHLKIAVSWGDILDMTITIWCNYCMYSAQERHNMICLMSYVYIYIYLMLYAACSCQGWTSLQLWLLLPQHRFPCPSLFRFF